jgi:hypothetical protein
MGTGNGLAQIKWGGTVPGADANTYVLFATCNPGSTQTDRVVQNANRDGGCPAAFFANTGTRKFVFSLKNSQAGTLNEYYSPDRGTTWLQISTMAIPIPAAGFTTEREFLVETYQDWKLEWLNGGVAQATWSPQMALSDQRAIP